MNKKIVIFLISLLLLSILIGAYFYHPRYFQRFVAEVEEEVEENVAHRRLRSDVHLKVPPVVNTTSISLLFGGDGHLNPILTRLKEKNGINYTYPWGNMYEYIKSMDGFIFNHEGTISDSPLVDMHPTKFQDPEGWTGAFSSLGNVILSLGNNHQFDWGLKGLLNTTNNCKKAGINYIGVGLSSEVRKPLIINYKGIRVGFWSIVAQVCTPVNDPPVRCTCRRWGEALPPQCLASNDTDPGLWLVDLQDPVSVDTALKDLKKSIFVSRKSVDYNIVLTHGGPAFSWMPTDERSDFYQKIVDIGADLVFGTGPAHIENSIFYKGKVIVFAPGQILFRHFPGIWGNCPPWAFPCQNYRPELAWLYQFNLEKNPSRGVLLKSVELVPIRHNHLRMKRAPLWDSDWLMKTLNQMRTKIPYSTRIIYDKTTKKYYLDLKN